MSSRPSGMSLLNIYHSSNSDLFKQGQNIAVVHPKAAVGGGRSNRFIPVSSVNAVASVAEDEYGNTQGIVWPRLDDSRKAGIVFADGWRGRPGGIQDFPGDCRPPRPFAARATYGD